MTNTPRKAEQALERAMRSDCTELISKYERYIDRELCYGDREISISGLLSDDGPSPKIIERVVRGLREIYQKVGWKVTRHYFKNDIGCPLWLYFRKRDKKRTK